MLNRQKLLLQLVRLAGRALNRLILTKWAFLVRHETTLRGGESFYDFVAYQYGPFSFALYQELEKLIATGYLKESSNSMITIGDVPAPQVEAKYKDELSNVIRKFSRSNSEQLLDYVYETYPQFTVNSNRKRLVDRRVAPLAIYTAGYERKCIDAFLHGLVEHGVFHLVDVRMNPIARRYGFHRSTLERLTGKLGIAYTHVPSLGIRSELRQHLISRNDYDALFRHYEAVTLKSEHNAIRQVAGLMTNSPSVLVCMEADYNCCHRSRLARSVSEVTGLDIVHLS